MRENERFWKPPQDVPTSEQEDDLADLYQDDEAFKRFIESPVMTELPVVTSISPYSITSSEVPQTLTLTGSNLSRIKKSGLVKDQDSINGELGKADDKSLTVTILPRSIGAWKVLV